jgi:hypothetical protein
LWGQAPSPEKVMGEAGAAGPGPISAFPSRQPSPPRRTAGLTLSADKMLTMLRHDTAMSNEQIARQIVAKLLAFRTVTPFGTTWEAFAVAEILAALNAAGRPEIRHKRSVARREPYETKGG